MNIEYWMLKIENNIQENKNNKCNSKIKSKRELES